MALCLAFLAVGFCGCFSAQVEIKEADFSGEKLYNKRSRGVTHLNENEVLGLQKVDLTDQEIQDVLDAKRNFILPRGSNILLVQSGSAMPDAAMQKELGRVFQVIPHSGLENDLRSDPNVPLSQALRMTAARSGAETVMVYWGTLEMRRKELGTDVVTWLPVLDFTIPDEIHKMRLGLKVALVDVRSGSWITYQTEPFETEALSTRYAREHTEPGPLNQLKKRAYKAAVEEMVKRYTR